MTYKTRQEVLRAAADWMDVCESTGIVANVKHFGIIFPIQKIGFLDDPEYYEFPLALLEGKEVWVGSELYSNTFKQFIKVTGKYSEGYLSFEDKSAVANADIENCSWNPPKPKTVMVEMLVDDAEYYANEKELPLHRIEAMIARRAADCKKALENLK